MIWFRIFAVVATALSSLPVLAQPEIPIEILAGNIHAGEIDELIAENAHNPVVAFDLLNLKAEVLADAGEPMAAAETRLVMIALFERFPNAIAADLPSLLLDSADLFLEAGDVPRAIQQLYAAVDALRERAANRELLGGVLRRIAELEAGLVARKWRGNFAQVPTH